MGKPHPLALRERVVAFVGDSVDCLGPTRGFGYVLFGFSDFLLFLKGHFVLRRGRLAAVGSW